MLSAFVITSFFFFKQKTAYEMRISDWSSDVCSSDLPLKSLRAIANLYPETIHLVVSAEAGIESVSDIKGKRISLDRPGSGTRVDAQLVLRAFGIHASGFEAFALGPGAAADELRHGALGGFLFLVRTPGGIRESVPQVKRVWIS